MQTYLPLFHTYTTSLVLKCVLNKTVCMQHEFLRDLYIKRNIDSFDLYSNIHCSTYGPVNNYMLIINMNEFMKQFYRCTTISWRCLQNAYNIHFMSTNIRQRCIILNLGYCRVFAETFSAKTRQYPRFNIMYRWFMLVDIKRMMYVFCKQRQLILVHLYSVKR